MYNINYDRTCFLAICVNTLLWKLGRVGSYQLSCTLLSYDHTKQTPLLERSGNCSAYTQETEGNFQKGDVKISCQVS
jgi:hypothetical protein